MLPCTDLIPYLFTVSILELLALKLQLVVVRLLILGKVSMLKITSSMGSNLWLKTDAQTIQTDHRR